jgi:hypothetical protein
MKAALIQGNRPGFPVMAVVMPVPPVGRWVIIFIFWPRENPVKYTDPDGREIEDDLPTIWTEPVFVFGLTGSATFPLLSAAITESMYFVPDTNKISLADYSTLFTAFVTQATSTNMFSKAVLPIVASNLIKNSSDIGFLTELMSSGTGTPFGSNFQDKGFSASAGFTVGIFRNINDIDNFYFDIGSSLSIGMLGFGLDAVFNENREVTGFMGMAGFAAGTIGETHGRFGYSFRYSLMQGKQ